jgi:hypothetical protein
MSLSIASPENSDLRGQFVGTDKSFQRKLVDCSSLSWSKLLREMSVGILPAATLRKKWRPGEKYWVMTDVNDPLASAGGNI